MKPMTAVLILENNKLLCIHNIKHGTPRIEPPGGKKEQNETLEDCAIRELKKEIGCDIQISRVFWDYKTNSPEGEFNVRMYLAEISKGTPQNQESAKHKKVEWCSYQDLLRYKEKGHLVPNLVDALPVLYELLK